MATKGERTDISEPHAQIFEVGSDGMDQANLEDETRLWRLINSLFSQLRKDCPIFGVLVIGETGSGKSTLINNLLGKEVAQVGHTPESETQAVTPHEVSVERVPVVVYDTPGLDDAREDEDDEEKHLDIMKSLLARGKIHLVIFCLKMTETRIRRGLVRTFKEYHKIGVPWEQTVITLTFADNVKDTMHWFSQMQQHLKKTLTDRAGVLPGTVKKLKICPTAKYPNEALPNGRPWFVPFWLNVVEVLLPAALVQFLVMHKGNILMETVPASSEPKLVNVTLTGEDMERFRGKVSTLSEPQEVDSTEEGCETISLDEEEGSAKSEIGAASEKSHQPGSLTTQGACTDNDCMESTPLFAPLQDPPSLPPPIPPVWEGVCRFNANPFMLTWEQKEVPVVVQSNQVQLIHAFIMEPKEAPRNVAIVSYISCDVITEQAIDPRGHLVVGVSYRSSGIYQSTLGKSPDFIKSVINRGKEEGVTLALYLCQGGPKHLAEQTYSDCITNLQSRQGPEEEEEEDLVGGKCKKQILNLNPVIPSNHKYSPVYITGSSRLDSSHLYQMITQGGTTEVYPTHCSDSNDCGLLSGCDSGSLTSQNSTESGNSGSPVARPIPVLLLSQVFSLKWEPVSTMTVTTQDGQRYATPLRQVYMLQNVDCKKLEEIKLCLNPSLELLYVKPNTICVYTINLEQLSNTPHEIFSEMCDFLSLFHSLRKPAGMQVILAAVYDYKTKYGQTLHSRQRDWLFQKISQALKSKFNEILHKDDRDCIVVVPINLAKCAKSAKQMQAVISECVNRYYQRVKGIDKDTKKMRLQQWPLFRQKVIELACRRHVVSWEELARLARQFLWIDNGELLEHCLTALEQSTSLWACHGTPGKKNEGFLVNPDIVVSIISRMAEPDTYKKIKSTLKREVAELLCAPSSATQSVLSMMVDTHLNIPVSGLIQWMQTMGILFIFGGAAAKDPCYFVPSITSSAQWEEAHGPPLPDKTSAELFIELRVPGADTPHMPTLFFYQFVAHIVSTQGIYAASNLSVSQGCTRVKISSLKLTGFLMPCEAVLSYDRLQCIIRIQLQPWKGAIIPTAHAYFRDVLKDCEANYGWNGMSRAIIGPAFQAASSNARCTTLFAFLDKMHVIPSLYSQPATFVVDANSLKEMSTRGIEPQLHVRIQDGGFRSYKVSEIVGLNQWIYNPTLRYENKEADVNRMKALNKVAEWLLQDPPLCAIIACEKGIIGAQDPEAHTWSTNTGPVPAAYKLIQQWHARKLPLSQLREALQKHHHNAAARILLPFCDGVPQTEL